MATDLATGESPFTERVQGYLFSDLRGYTAYAEREGDRAAVELLDRYRVLVRRALHKTGGAEIRTEGDSFYATFSSAGQAVRAGLAIARDAAAATADDPAHPILPGIGVHIGEAADGSEGPVGSAVNLAARLCAAAAPGEVLVSGTVRDLLRTSGWVAFDARGRRAFKGIAEPVETWSARVRTTQTSEAATGLGSRPLRSGFAGRRAQLQPRRWLRAPVLAGGGIVAAVLVAGTLLLPSLGSPGKAASTAAAEATGSATAVAQASTATAARSPTTGSLAPSASPTGPAASATAGVYPNAAEAALLADLPRGLTGECQRGATQDDAKLAGFEGKAAAAAAGVPLKPVMIDILPPPPTAGVLCRPQSGASRLYVRRQTRSVGGSDISNDADEYLGYFEGRHNIAIGSCATDPRAYQLWTRVDGGVGGTLACLRVSPADGRSWIYFTFGDGRYLAFATREDANYAELWAWWEQLRRFLP